MWVFDGETWTREGGGEEAKPSVSIRGPEEMMPEMMPELQIMEIVVPTPRTTEIYVPVAVPTAVPKPR